MIHFYRKCTDSDFKQCTQNKCIFHCLAVLYRTSNRATTVHHPNSVSIQYKELVWSLFEFEFQEAGQIVTELPYAYSCRTHARVCMRDCAPNSKSGEGDTRETLCVCVCVPHEAHVRQRASWLACFGKSIVSESLKQECHGRGRVPQKTKV